MTMRAGVLRLLVMLACWASVLQPLVAHATTEPRPWEAAAQVRTRTRAPTGPESRQKALSGREDGRPRAEVTRRAFEELHRSLPGRLPARPAAKAGSMPSCLPPLWLLLAACGAVDLDTVFFDGVEAERPRLRLGGEFFGVTGLPHHKFDVSFEPGVPIAFSTTLPRPEDYVQRGVAFGGRPLPDGPIGVAVNGVAIYAYNTNLTNETAASATRWMAPMFMWRPSLPLWRPQPLGEGGGLHWLWHKHGRTGPPPRIPAVVPKRRHRGDERRLSAVWASG